MLFKLIISAIIVIILMCISLTHQSKNNIDNNKEDSDATESKTETDVNNKERNGFDIYSEHTKDWIDFGNMFSYDTNTKTQIKTDANNNKVTVNSDECVCNDSIRAIDNQPHECNCDDIIKKLQSCKNDNKILNEASKMSACNQRMVAFVNRAVQRLINKLTINFKTLESYDTIEDKSVEVCARIYESDVKLVEQFISLKPIVCNKIEKFEDVITETIDRLAVVDNSKFMFFELIISKYWFYLAIALLSVAVIVFIYKFYLMQFHFKVVTLYGLLFVISFTWEWIKLYQSEIAKKHLAMSSAPSECVNMEFGENTFSSFLWSYMWSKEDKCRNYYSALMVNPIWEVNPMVAISSTLASAAFKPIVIFFEYFGKGLSSFYSYFSFFEKIFITLAFIPLSFLFACIFMGYSFKLPFFLGSIERNTRVLPVEQNVLRPITSDNQISSLYSYNEFMSNDHQNRIKPYTRLSTKPKCNNALKRSQSFNCVSKF